MNQPAIDIQDLTYTYTGEKKASVQSVSLQIAKGKRFGLFGPNGAGKTTLISCMTGLLNGYQGEIKVLGEKPESRNLKKKIGFVPQDFAFYHELSVNENLDFFGALHGLQKTEIKKRAEELCTILNLQQVAHKSLAQLSGGMKRRLNLAIGLLNKPEVLFLDEPTVGVDIQTRMDIIAHLKKINEKGCTLIYTSHQLSEAEELCDDVAFICKGKVLARNTLSMLRNEYGENDLEKLFIRITGSASHHDE